MTDQKLFRLVNGQATSLKGIVEPLEKPIQRLLDKNLHAILGVHFLATEFTTGKLHSGRIDSLGIDENGCPVTLRDYLHSMGDDVQEKANLDYIAFRRLKNFACVEVHSQPKRLLVFLKVDPSGVEMEEGFTRDVRTIGHFGTGDLELSIRSVEDLEKAKQFILQSYEGS